MERLLTFIFLLPLHFVDSQSVDYHNESITVIEGHTATLYCGYTGSTSYLKWFMLSPGKGPVELISLFNDEIKKKEKFDAQLETKNKRSFLHFTNPSVTDTALYICAVDATSGLNRLTFGKGTMLTVIPKTERTIPSVYKLKSSSLTESLPNSVCLITDFPSPNKTLQINGKDVDLNDMAVLDESTDNKWRYSTVTWDTNEDDDACNGKYDENDLVAEYEAENTDETCSSISIDETFRTNPDLNTLSIQVVGWRVFTAKAIVFNLMITLRLWSS